MVVSEHTTAREVLVSASIGSTLAGLGGLTRTCGPRSFHRAGDVAAGRYAGRDRRRRWPHARDGDAARPVGGRTRSNARGSASRAGGWPSGSSLHPRPTHHAAAGCFRVGRGWRAVGGGAPFLLYAAIHTSSSTADERVNRPSCRSVDSWPGAYLGFPVSPGAWTRASIRSNGKPKKEVVDDAPDSAAGRA